MATGSTTITSTSLKSQVSSSLSRSSSSSTTITATSASSAQSPTGTTSSTETPKTNNVFSTPTSTSTSPTISASTTRMTPTATRSPSSKNTISSGATAGIGIGTALIGALIGALLVWFCMRKRARDGHQSSSYRANSTGRIEPEMSFGTQSGVVLEDSLLERADDSQIRQSLSGLTELLDQHTESHYHLHAVDPQQVDLSHSLQSSGYDTLMKQKPSIPDLSAILLNPRTRFAAIRQFICLIIISHLDWQGESQSVLLPSQIVTFCRSIAPVERQAGAKEVFDQAFLKWKTLSAYLIEPARSVKREAPKPDRTDLQNAIARNVQMINTVLEPFLKAVPDRRQAQVDNLSAVVFQAAELGLLLFAQPSEWRFFWEEPSTNAQSGARKSTMESLVVFPGVGEMIRRNSESRFRRVVNVVEVSL